MLYNVTVISEMGERYLGGRLVIPQAIFNNMELFLDYLDDCGYLYYFCDELKKDYTFEADYDEHDDYDEYSYILLYKNKHVLSFEPVY